MLLVVLAAAATLAASPAPSVLRVAVADTRPAPSAECLWAGLPAQSRGSLVANYAVRGIKGLEFDGPILESLLDNMERCGFGPSTGPTAQAASGYAMRMATQARLQVKYGVTPEALDRAWTGVPPAEKAAFLERQRASAEGRKPPAENGLGPLFHSMLLRLTTPAMMVDGRLLEEPQMDIFFYSQGRAYQELAEGDP